MCLLKNICFKDKVKPVHWVGHSQLRSLDTDDFFKRTPVVDKKKAIVNGNRITQSVSWNNNNPVLLQEEEENVAEKTNDDADVNVESNKVNDKNKYMVVKMKEERKTL